MDYTSRYLSPLGYLIMASDGESLIGLWFERQKHFASTLGSQHQECDDLPVFVETKRWLDSYFSGQVPDFTPKLMLRATPFRQAVWEILLTIPYGKTMTYGEIAKQYVETCHGASLQGVMLQGASLQSAPLQGAKLHDALLHGVLLKGMSQPTKSMSAQAVGGAVGCNPISLIIPCHRVIGANGSLTGYAGGLERKKYLLEMEQGFRNCV
ncbi:MAG: methylated-DNA--[protein]-cysteine S-methyltransferase [Bacteroidales bacterium]|nr:methylated-DNA--[protein]-cysteine S-methyltransferase [Bacteroidales bacterium]